MNKIHVPDGPPAAATFGGNLLISAQHMVLVLGNVALVPSLLGSIYNIPPATLHHMIFATAVGAAIATAMQMVSWRRFGLGEVLFMSTAGAYLPCAHTALELGGVQLLAALGLLSAVVRVVYGLFLYRLRHILTPTVGGVVIMLAVTGLLKDAARTWTGPLDLLSVMARERILVGCLTMAAMLASERLGGRRLRPWSLILGMGAGTILSVMLGHVDLSVVDDAKWFGLPNPTGFLAIGELTLRKFVLFLAFSVAALVTCIKYTGDAMAVQRISNPDRNKPDYEAIQNGVYAAAVGSLPSCLLGGMPIASSSSNVALLSMTSSTSRIVGWIGSLLVLAGALCPKLLMAMTAIPGPVLGASAVVLVGHLFATGLQLAASQGLRYRNSLIVGVSLVLGLLVSHDEFFPNSAPDFLAPLLSNGFAVGGLTAILLTLGLQLSSRRRTIIRIRTQSEDLVPLAEQAGAFSERHGLTARDARFLELTCEETAGHMIREMAQAGKCGQITFRLELEEREVRVEATARARMSEADDNDACPDPETATDEDLQRLGLVLLNRAARGVNHVHISGYTVINFSLPVNR